MGRPTDPGVVNVMGHWVPDLEGRDCDGGAMPDQIDRTGVREAPGGPNNPNATLSDQALLLIDGARAEAYGTPADNLSRIGATWAAMLGLPEPIPAFRVALMMAALKAVRAAHEPTDDSLIDLAGYAELARRLR